MGQNYKRCTKNKTYTENYIYNHIYLNETRMRWDVPVFISCLNVDDKSYSEIYDELEKDGIVTFMLTSVTY